MSQINPYLNFNGNCREAMRFYKNCLGGELTMQTVGESPMANQWPAAMQKHVLHSMLSNGGILLLGSDMGGQNLVEGNTVSLSLTCSTEEEIRRFFTNLSDGGEIQHPLHEFFAGIIGALTDKFGKSWTFYYAKNQN